MSAAKDESFVHLTAGIPLSSQFCPLTILDDAQYPVIEGLETFVVYLSSPHGAELAKPFQAIVAINDIFQDGELSLAAVSVPFQPLGSLWIPSTPLALFLPPCSAQHAVHQGHLHGQGEGGDPAHPCLPHGGPELRVLCQVLYPEPDSTGHGGLHGEEGCRGVSHHFPQRGEGELDLPHGGAKNQCWERFTSIPWLSSEGADRVVQAGFR